MREYYHGTGINASMTEISEGRTVLFLLEALCDLFEAHFDNGWFLNILEKMSFSSVSLREIRTMMQLKEIYESDVPKLENGLESLREFISFTEKYVRPVLRDELGVSGFKKDLAVDSDPMNTVLKGFFLYTFPHNLARLADLHAQLVPMVYILKGRDPVEPPAVPVWAAP